MHPARLVDGRGVDWFHQTTTTGRAVYRSQHLALTRAEVERRFPPTRPVEPPPADSAARLSAAVYDLCDDPDRRHLLVGTLCVALDDVGQVAGRTCPLTAASPGSSESLTITTMAYVLGPDLTRDPDRYDPPTRHEVADVVLDWVTGPDRYVQVGESLAALIGPPAARAGGWDAVADDRLRVGPYVDVLAWYVTSRAEVPA